MSSNSKNMFVKWNVNNIVTIAIKDFGGKIPSLSCQHRTPSHVLMDHRSFFFSWRYDSVNPSLQWYGQERWISHQNTINTCEKCDERLYRNFGVKFIQNTDVSIESCIILYELFYLCFECLCCVWIAHIVQVTSICI